MAELAIAAALSTAPVATKGAAGAKAAAVAAAGEDGAAPVDPFAALMATLKKPVADSANPPAEPVAVDPAAIAQIVAQPAKLGVAAGAKDGDGEDATTAQGDQTEDGDGTGDPALAMMLAMIPLSAPPAAAAASGTATQVTGIAGTVAGQAGAVTPQLAGGDPKAGDQSQPQPQADGSAPAQQGQLPPRLASLVAQLMGGTAQGAADPAAAASAATISPAAQQAADAAGAKAAAVPIPGAQALAGQIQAQAPGTPQAVASAARKGLSIEQSAIGKIGRTGRTATNGATPDTTLTVAANLTTSQQADPASATGGTVAASGTAPADAAVTRELSMAKDSQWLDTLARDIAATGKDGQLSFRLDPYHLGSLTVHITHDADGASIRMSADTDAARQMLVDAQPKLVAEARAQGLNLRDSSVDMGGSGFDQNAHQGASSAFAGLAGGQGQGDSGGSNHRFINLNAVEGDQQEPVRQAPSRSDLYA